MTPAEIEKYMILSRSSRFQALLERTKATIREALKIDGEWLISFSGGKDSTVMADLLYSCGWSGRGMYFWYSQYENPPENDRQVDWANSRYGFSVQKLKCYGSYDAWLECGHFFSHPETQIEKKCAGKIANSFREQSGSMSGNLFIGMCKEESRAREIALSKKGQIYQTNDRKGWTCCPLAYWTAADIWAYIVSRSLPYLSIYDLPHWSRERIRNELTVIYCPDLVLKGELLQYKLAYPELYSRLCAEFPEIRRFL